MLSNTTIILHEEWNFSLHLSVMMLDTSEKLHSITNFFPNWLKTTLQLSEWCHMMLFCLSALCICTHTAYWKGHCPWLLSHWEPTCQLADMTLFECVCVHMIRAAASTTYDKVTRVSKQPTNRPVLSQTGSWEQQRRCLVSSASSNHVWWCAQLYSGRLFWF